MKKYSSICFFYYKKLIRLGDAPEINGLINVGYDEDEGEYMYVPVKDVIKKQSIRNCHHWWLAANDDNIKQLGVTYSEVAAFKKEFNLENLSDLLDDSDFLSESGKPYDRLLRLALSKGALRIRKYFDTDLLTIMGKENNKLVRNDIIDFLLDNETLYTDYTNIAVNFASENKYIDGGGCLGVIDGTILSIIRKLQY